ncbi:MAG: hypothetical protein LBE02_04190 [Spirochaetaceae bacterium]|jgi:hypothetical protein|nr:hypothetical protein [Spirochaetaceae bacterium]
MKKAFVLLVLIVGVLLAGGLGAQSNGKTINFISVTADGDSGKMTEFIELQLSGAGIDDLRRNDIIITPGITIGSWRFFKSGGVLIYEFYFNSVQQTQELTVSIEKPGYTVTPPSRTVMIFNGKTPAP